jgi:hypothetical protein
MFGSLGESISQIFGITQYALLVSGDLNAGNNWRSDAVKLPPAASRIRPSARGYSPRQGRLLGRLVAVASVSALGSPRNLGLISAANPASTIGMLFLSPSPRIRLFRCPPPYSQPRI